MLRIGLVDIDTSHAWIYANYVNNSGRACVTHITDMGSIWPEEHVQRFAELVGARIVPSPEAMLDEVDGAMILGARYDLHLERARPFLEVGKAVFLDKPAVGCIRDVKTLQRWIDDGARLLCGSSFPFCPELEPVRQRVTAGGPCSLTVVGCREFFEHGIHAADLALTLTQSKPIEVQWGVLGPCEVLWVRLANYIDVLLQLESTGGDWMVSVSDTRGTLPVVLDLDHHGESHYARLAEAFVDLVQNGRVPYSPQWHVEAICTLIAGKVSRDHQAPVQVAELPDEAGFDGLIYTQRYARLKPNSKTYLQPSPEHLLSKRVPPASARPPSLSRRILRFGKKLVTRGPYKATQFGKLVLTEHPRAAVREMRESWRRATG